jgi:hypothetical protein
VSTVGCRGHRFTCLDARGVVASVSVIDAVSV